MEDLGSVYDSATKAVECHVARMCSCYATDHQLSWHSGVRSSQHINKNAAALDLVLDEDDLGFIADELKRCQDLPGDVYSLERNRWQLPGVQCQ